MGRPRTPTDVGILTSLGEWANRGCSPTFDMLREFASAGSFAQTTADCQQPCRSPRASAEALAVVAPEKHRLVRVARYGQVTQGHQEKQIV
jgi:hypothetical protein